MLNIKEGVEIAAKGGIVGIEEEDPFAGGFGDAVDLRGLGAEIFITAYEADFSRVVELLNGFFQDAKFLQGRAIVHDHNLGDAGVVEEIFQGAVDEGSTTVMGDGHGDGIRRGIGNGLCAALQLDDATTTDEIVVEARECLRDPGREFHLPERRDSAKRL
jgi:hypothetical protein